MRIDVVATKLTHYEGIAWSLKKYSVLWNELCSQITLLCFPHQNSENSRQKRQQSRWNSIRLFSNKINHRSRKENVPNITKLLWRRAKITRTEQNNYSSIFITTSKFTHLQLTYLIEDCHYFLIEFSPPKILTRVEYAKITR